jgi:hypothetical protein
MSKFNRWITYIFVIRNALLLNICFYYIKHKKKQQSKTLKHDLQIGLKIYNKSKIDLYPSNNIFNIVFKLKVFVLLNIT